MEAHDFSKPAHLDESTQAEHASRLLRNTVDNIELYMGRLRGDPEDKLGLRASVLCNALAQHTMSASRMIDWQAEFASVEAFRRHYLQSMVHGIHRLMDFMEENEK